MSLSLMNIYKNSAAVLFVTLMSCFSEKTDDYNCHKLFAF